MSKKRTKSRHGTGSVRWNEKRKCYEGKISLGTDAKGRRIRPTFRGPTIASVQRQMDEAKQQALKGTLAPSGRLSIAEHFEAWLRARESDLAPTTFSQYKMRYENHIKPFLGNMQVKDLQYTHVEEFYEALRDEKKLSPRTVRDIASLLRQVLDDAVRKNISPVNQAKIAINPRTPRREARFFTYEELELFFIAAEGDLFKDFFILALHTGLRASELLGLSWDAVDFFGRKIMVRQALHEVNGSMQMGMTKTPASRRIISVSKEGMEALERQRVRQRELRQANSSAWKGNHHNLVFTNQVGAKMLRTNISSRNLRRILNRAALLKAARRLGRSESDEQILELNKDIPARRLEAGDEFLLPNGLVEPLLEEDLMTGAGIHTFRHTHASILIASGVDILTVSRRLGHENITITLDLYGHLMPGQDESAANAMDRLFSSLG